MSRPNLTNHNDYDTGPGRTLRPRPKLRNLMIWNQTKECMSREQMRQLQGERLRKLVHRVYHNVPFYRDKMQQAGMIPDDIRSIDDIVRLPFTTKQDLRDNYPYGLFAVPMSQIVRIHASSGTTGRPTVVGYTHRDLSVWSESIARCLMAFGATRDDIFTVAYGYGLFTGGLGLHYGVEHLGGTVIPMSTGNTAKHIQLMHDFGSTALACTPSYALYLAERSPVRVFRAVSSGYGWPFWAASRGPTICAARSRPSSASMPTIYTA